MIPTAQHTASGNSGGGVRRFLITGLVIVLVAVASSVTTYLLTRDTDSTAGQRTATTATPTPSATTARPGYFSVHGTMTVEADYWDGVGEGCTTGGGYDGIRGGAAVIIRADDGSTLNSTRPLTLELV